MSAEEARSLLSARDRARVGDDAATANATADPSDAATATRPAGTAASSLDASAAASSSSSLSASSASGRLSVAHAPRGSGAPLLHLTIQRTDLPRMEVSVPSDWTMMQLRELAYPPAADAVDPAIAAAAAPAAASSSSSSSAGFAPVLPNAPPAVSAGPAAGRPPRELIVLYCGRRIPASAWSSSLSALGIRSNSGLHMIWQDIIPLPSYQAGDAAAAAHRDEYFDRGWDRYSREPLGSWLEFALGLTLGFLLGFLALLWLLQPRVSRRCRIGILTGLSCNLFVGISQMMHRRDEYQHAGPTPAGAPSRSIAGNGGNMIYTVDDQGEPHWRPRAGPRLIGPTRASSSHTQGAGEG